MSAYTLAEKMAVRNHEMVGVMRKRLCDRTGIAWESFAEVTSDNIAYFFAAFAKGDMGVDQMTRMLASNKYYRDDDWRARYQSVRAALYRLLWQNQDEAHYAQMDIRAFNAPSECFGLVMHQQENRTHEAVQRIFKQVRMDPKLFFALNNAHGHKHCRLADDIDAPEFYLDMEFRYHFDDPYFRKHRSC